MGSTSDTSQTEGSTDLPSGRQSTGPLGILQQIRSRLTGKAAKSAGNGDSPAAKGSSGPAVAAQPGLANLRRLRVDDVAIPKAEITAVPVDITKDALVEVFRQHGFSRVPVFKDSLDHPLGLVLLKDFALQHGFGTASSRFSMKKLLRPVIFAPPSMAASTLLQRMQRERAHMALVIDEYGGVDGLVTIEDLIETIIGEIDDEHDEAQRSEWREVKPGVWVVQAGADVEEFEAAINFRLRQDSGDDDIDTVGGLVFSMKGSVPRKGEVLAFPGGAVIEVIDADARRVKRLRVRLPGSAAGEGATTTTVETPSTSPNPDKAA
jgi:magnesium and cobalt transporter